MGATGAYLAMSWTRASILLPIREAASFLMSSIIEVSVKLVMDDERPPSPVA